MIDMLKRHEIQVLRRAGHTLTEVAHLSGVSVRTVQRVVEEDAITTVDNAAERARREVGRPSTAAEFREVLVQALTEDPALKTVELLHRAKQAGYTGGKSALYALAQTVRTRVVTPVLAAGVRGTGAQLPARRGAALGPVGAAVQPRRLVPARLDVPLRLV